MRLKIIMFFFQIALQGPSCLWCKILDINDIIDYCDMSNDGSKYFTTIFLNFAATLELVNVLLYQVIVSG